MYFKYLVKCLSKNTVFYIILISVGEIFLNRIKEANITGNQLANILLKTTQILTKYCILTISWLKMFHGEIHNSILKTHVHSELVLP